MGREHVRFALTKAAYAATSALTLVTPAIFTPAMAQSGASVGGGDIVVTARRTEERLQDVPISITVFNEEQISEKNIVSGADLATYTPSLSANSRFGSETATFAIRGFVQENFTSPSVAVYFADVIGPRAQGGTSGGNGAGVGQFFDLQNVQVLKGPQGTLFGRNTTGGAVLIVPQRPTNEFEGYVEGSIGNYDMMRLQAVVNIPLADSFKVRLGVDRQKRDGFLKNRSGIGADDFNDVDYIALRGSVLAELTPDLENYTIVRYSKSETNGTTGKIVGANAPGCRDGVDPARFGGPQSTAAFLAPLACSQTLARARELGYGYWDVESNHPDPRLDIMQWSVINTTTWNASDTITLKNIASYQEFTQRQGFNIGSDNYVIPDSNPNPAFRGLPFTWVGLNPDPVFPNVEQRTFTEEFQVQGRTGDGKLNYVVGAYYEKSSPMSPFQGSQSPIAIGGPGFYIVPVCSDLTNYQCTTVTSFGTSFVPPPLSAAIPGALIQNSLTRYDFENIGFFAQGTYSFTDQFSATGGIRYTIDKVIGEGGTRRVSMVAPNAPVFDCAANPTIPAASGEDCISRITQKSEKPTWLLGLDFKPTDDTLLYAKYSRGYRQGNVNASNTIPISWGPEKVDAYEIGAKASFRGEVNGFVNFAAFYNDFSDQQLSANLIPLPGSTNSPSQGIVNAGKSRIAGFEMDGTVNWQGLSLQGGYTYLDTKLKSYTPPIFAGYLPPTTGSEVGGALPLSPKHKLTLTPSYTLPLDEANGSVTISATYIYTSKQTAFADSPFGILPATNLWNLNLGWNNVMGSPVDAAFFMTNLTNEKYPVYSGGGWSSTGSEALILGQPRMYGGRLRVRFGGGDN